ncbi:hypothetical protein M3202_18600 [Alkalihalobacillus oceani]|uniref:Uncharacterized protein n=1 Tax=Halalkalibacter oceani TaxID=1653776 RepID=A0A9X2DS08_9BACI|nr:hypothetical protein [Halalkalibacter oceani]MCM3716066.1 hypothetical protein [Halalkalibacter oceani]
MKPIKRKFHVLEDELDRLEYGPPKTLKAKWLWLAHDLLSSTVSITIQVPAYVVLRTKILCEDIEEKAEQPFHPADLIELLYDDFLINLKETNHLYTTYRQLLSHSIEPAEVTTFQGDYFKRVEKRTSLRLHLARKKVLRGEVFIYDVSQQVNHLDITIENILEILLTDFMKKYCSGDVPQLLDDLIHRLSND